MKQKINKFKIKVSFIFLIIFMTSVDLKANENQIQKENIEIKYGIEDFVLKNGMRVIVNPDNSSNLINHYVVYNVGGLQDFHGKAGMAHFLEHMMFKGTKNHKEGELTKFFNDNGIIFNAGTGHEITVYYATCVRKENEQPLSIIEKVMDFESDRMQNLVLKKEEIDIERNVIKEERRMRVDNVIIPSFIEKLNALHYDSSYYGASLIGLMTDIDNIKLNDLENFYKKYYDPSNATLILSGNISKNEAEKLAKQYYEVLENRIEKKLSEDSLKNNAFDLVKTKIDNRLYLDLKSDKAKSPTYIQIFSAPTLKTESKDLKSALALDILAFLLSEGKDMMFSRFVEQEKIASNFFVSYESFGEDFYPLKLIFNTSENEKLNLFEEKIQLFFQNELPKILTDEIIKKTAKIIGINHIYTMDNLENRAEFISYASLIKKIENPGQFLNEYPKLLLEISKDDILKVVDEVFIKGPSTIGKIFEKKK